ncbi:MAG: hypothetical protein ACK4F5_05005 [Aliihoeflea sp.]
MEKDTGRRRVISAAQWIAAREMAEGAAQTYARIATLLGCDVSAVYARASAEGWKRLDFRRADVRETQRHLIALAESHRGEQGFEAEEQVPEAEEAIADPETAPEEDPLDMVARGTSVLAKRLGTLISRADKGGRLNKAEFDGLAAMARMIERWETLAQERARKDEKKSDEELAEAISFIQRRTVELAREEAERLVAAGFGREVGGETG